MKILIIGGNRFFGKHLAHELLNDGYAVTLLNRGNAEDGFGDRVSRLKADRQNEAELQKVVSSGEWDFVFDQVCYGAQEARSACTIFQGKVRRYIVTSSESVYDNGFDQKESSFNPKTYHFTKDANPSDNYQEAKRQVEAVFSQAAPFEVAVVRPSLVVGMDDYTNRLKWHLDRIKNSQPIYFPKLGIASDFIRSDQAAHAMKAIGLSKAVGPVNCTTKGFIRLSELIAMCESIVGKKAVIAEKHEGENHSPYGGAADKTMNTDLLYSLGFSAPQSSEWMPSLIREIWATELSK